MKEHLTLTAKKPFVGLTLVSIVLSLYVNFAFLSVDKRFSGIVFLFFFAPAFFVSVYVTYSKKTEWTWTRVSIWYAVLWIAIFGTGLFFFVNAIS